MLIRLKTHFFNYLAGYVFSFSQLVVFISSFMNSELINYTFSLTSAQIMHTLLSVFFLIGYLFKKRSTLKSSNQLKEISPYFYIVAIMFSLLGLIVTLWQISITVDPIEYLLNLFSGNFDINIRVAFGLSSENGGLSGFIKMFHIAPLAVFLMSSGHFALSNLSKRDKKKLVLLIFFVVIIIFLKIIFSLDRLTILSLLIGCIFIFKDNIFSPLFIISLIILLIVGNYISSIRLNGYSLFDFIILYSKSSIVNFELMIKTNSNFTYGFSTFLHPIGYFFEGLRFNITFPSSSQSWIWNPAQYFFSNLYQDFGIFSLFINLILGYLVRFFEYKSTVKKTFLSSYYLIFIFVIATFITVPLLRAPEFWFILFLISYLSRFITSYTNIFNLFTDS
jgi:hypothetical protein